MRPALVLALSLAGVSFAAGAANSMYRWVDAKGQVHYSQTPPHSGGFKDVTPRLPPPPVGKAAVGAAKPSAAAVPAPASVAEMNKKTAEYNDRIKEQNCKNSQAQLAQAQAQGTASVLRQQADGSIVPIGPEDHAREVAEAQKAVAASCGK